MKIYEECGGNRAREGARRGGERSRQRMKRESGMKGGMDRSRGTEMLIPETLDKIKPTDPLR
jgi:hypothetical protein